MQRALRSRHRLRRRRRPHRRGRRQGPHPVGRSVHGRAGRARSSRAKPGATIIADVKASQVLFDEIARMGGTPLMWRTGHSLIKSKMAETGAPLAGEMSGHIFYADRYYGYDDALYAAVRLLGILARGERQLADAARPAAGVVNTPELRFPCAETRKFAVIEEVARAPDARPAPRCPTSTACGCGPTDGWWLLRASNTQDVLVARAEARRRGRARSRSRRCWRDQLRAKRHRRRRASDRQDYRRCRAASSRGRSRRRPCASARAAARGLGIALGEVDDARAGKGGSFAACRAAIDQHRCGPWPRDGSSQRLRGGMLGGGALREGADLDARVVTMADAALGRPKWSRPRRARPARRPRWHGRRDGRSFRAVGAASVSSATSISPAGRANASFKRARHLHVARGADSPPMTTAMRRWPSRTAEAARLKPEARI